MIRRATLICALAALWLGTGSRPAAAQPSAALENYALFVLEGYRGKGSHVVSGDVGVNAGSLVSSGKLDAPTSRLVGDQVTLARPSQCAALFANQAALRGPGCGPPTSFASPIIADVEAACGFPRPFPTCDAASSIQVDHGATLDLAPGVYGAVVVSGGGRGPGMLRLTAGHYVFCSLKASRHAQVVVSGPAEIDVAGSLVLDNGSGFGAEEGGPTPGEIVVHVAGDAVRFSRKATVGALLCAPDAELRLTAGADLTGRFVARSILSDRVTVRAVSTPPSSTTSSTTPTSSTTSSTSSTTTSTAASSSTTTSTTTTTASTSTTTAPSTSSTTTISATTSTTTAPSTSTTTTSTTTSTTSAPSSTTTTTVTTTSTAAPTTSTTTASTTTLPSSTTTSTAASTTNTTSTTTTTAPPTSTTTTTSASTTTTTLGGGECSGGGITARLVVNYADVGAPALSGLRLRLGYPSSLSLPNIPGTDFVDSSRIQDLTGANGFLVGQNVNQTLDVVYGVTGATFPSGDFVEVQFDCAGGTVLPADFECSVVSASDQVGNDVQNPGAIPCAVSSLTGL